MLLKIDEDEIIEVSGEVEVSTVKEYMEKEVLEDIPELILDKEPPAFSTAMEEWEEKVEPISEESESISGIRIGGFFGKVYKIKRDGDKIIYERSPQTSFKPKTSRGEKDLIKSEKIKLQQNFDIKKTSSLLICPQCGRQSDSHQTECTNCGYKL